MGKVVLAQVTANPISVEEITPLVKSPEAGAIVTFSGDVRDNDREKLVASLEYEIHPSADEVIKKVTQSIADKHEITSVATAHRYGAIPIGEAAFVVAVSAKHRAAAFSACTELVDEIKAQIPIWKHQIFADGTDEWVNSA